MSNGNGNNHHNDNNHHNGSIDIDELTRTDDQPVKEVLAYRVHRRRQQQFIMVPMAWHKALAGATGRTVLLAHNLLYLGWRRKGSLKLSNGTLLEDGISRQSKWRGLADLERRGLITVERRPNRSPIVTLLRV